MKKTVFTRIHCLLFSGLLIFGCNSPEPTSVMVLPTIHAAHEVNENYTYKDLFRVIRDYDPEVIGVEIRPVDMEMNSDSLDIFYPQEMIMVRDSFPGMVTGIDDYNTETRNMQVYKEMFTDTTAEMGRIKALVGRMSADDSLRRSYEKAGIPVILEEQKRIALNYSPLQFMKGEYDSLTGRQYRLEDSLYKGTVYEDYSRFNNSRDLEITRNSLNLIRSNPSKRILILVGANHRNRLVDSLKNDQTVQLVEKLDLEL